MDTRPAWIPAVLSTLLLAPPAVAELRIERRSDENPVVEVARSTAYGGLAGLTVGLALASLDDENPHPDLIQNSFAIGTFAGLGFGLYWAFSRAQPGAMIELDGEGPHLALAPPEIGPDGSPRLRLVGVSF